MPSPTQRLRQRIEERGAVDFSEFMEEALYGEGGYYTRPTLAIGKAGGDFVTGSTLSPLFARATARLLERLDRALGCRATLLEAGCGDGRHLAAVAAADAAPRRLIGWDRVARPLGEGLERLRRPEDLAAPIDGLVFSYELFDALPVNRLIGGADGSLGELWVTCEPTGSFAWKSGPLSDPALDGLLGGTALAPGQIADVSVHWRPLYSRLAAALGRGLLVSFDYGYERAQLLDPRVRRHGTLACYKEHRAHRNALHNVGDQDLTAHVDFTSLRECGEAAGLTTVAWTRQARWLTALGLFDDLAASPTLETRLEAAALLDPDGMGDQIRVLVQARGVEAEEVLDPALLGGARAIE